MNKKDRRKLKEVKDVAEFKKLILEELQEMKITFSFQTSVVDILQSNEDEKYENLSEGFQASSLGESLEECSGLLGELSSAIGDIIEKINDAIDIADEIITL